MARKTFKKIIVTDEKLSKVNAKNAELTERFLREKSMRSSEGTIKGYRSDLNIFFVWNLLHNENKLFPDIKKLELSDFFYWCVEELKWSTSRSSRMRSTLSSFSQFIEKFMDEEYPDFRNIVLMVVESMPKSPRREKTVLSENQIDEILTWADHKNPQIACWIALAISSGSRFSELLRIGVDIIDEKNTVFEGLFIETSKPIKVKGRGKEGKMSKKYIIRELFLKRYQTWLQIRKEIMEKNSQNHSALFIKKNGEPAEDGTVRSWVATIERAFGIHFYPHSLRHYCTTYLSRVGLPSQLIQELIGWETAEMVNVYDDTDVKDKKWSELDLLRQKISN